MDRNRNAARKFNSPSRRLKQVVGQSLERLEARQMLSGDPYSIKNAYSFTPTSSNILDLKQGPLAKGGQGMLDIYRAYTQHLKGGGNRYQFPTTLSNLYVIEGRDVLVNIRATGSLAKARYAVEGLKGRIVYKDATRELLQAFVPIDSVPSLASNKNILHVRPSVRGVTASMGAVSNDAERAMKTEYVLPAFGVDGSGQKIGVISDTFDARTSPQLLPNGGPFYFAPNPFEIDDIMTGDLPAGVEVLYDEGIGTNEGRAMLQLIHDLAPGADLAFHAVGNTIDQFANAVLNLRDAGSTVIVDDISFATSPYFGEGVLERAINDVVDDGAMYFAAQRNSGNAAYAAATNWVSDPHKSGGLMLDFDPSDKVDTKLRVKIDQAGHLFLQWDDVYDGTVANITADVDLYVYRGDALIYRSIDDNFATGAPYEVVTITDPGYYDVVIRTNRLSRGAQAPSFFKLSANGNQAGMFNGATGIEYAGNNSSTVGQTGARGTIAVGAVPYTATTAFGEARNLVTEDFSSAGPVIRVYDQDGNRFPTPEIVLAPLLSGVDRTATNVAGFESFPGTSAAAPHVAAVAALLRQIAPDATPEDIKQALVESAKTQPVNGTAAGEWDPRGGYGLVNAIAAAHILNPDVPVSNFSVPAVNAGRVNSVTVTFSKPVSGVDLSDFILTRDGTSANRFKGGETVRTTDNGTTWIIENLASATSILGAYTLILRNNRTDIVDDDNNVAAGNVISFDVTLRKVRGVKIDNLDNGNIRLRFDASGTNAQSIRIQRSTTSNFSSVRNINLDANATQYIDNDVIPGQVYYYRIRAVQNGKLGDVASASIVNGSPGEVFVDQADAKFTGGWATYNSDNALFEEFARASGTKAGDPANTATFGSSSLTAKEYFVYVRYPSSSKSATNARFEILQGSKVISTQSVDQTQRSGGWVLLGKFVNDVTRGALSVRLTSLGANGSVTADAVRFLPAGEVED